MKTTAKQLAATLLKCLPSVCESEAVRNTPFSVVTDSSICVELYALRDFADRKCGEKFLGKVCAAADALLPGHSCEFSILEVEVSEGRYDPVVEFMFIGQPGTVEAAQEEPKPIDPEEALSEAGEVLVHRLHQRVTKTVYEDPKKVGSLSLCGYTLELEVRVSTFAGEQAVPEDSLDTQFFTSVLDELRGLDESKCSWVFNRKGDIVLFTATSEL